MRVFSAVYYTGCIIKTLPLAQPRSHIHEESSRIQRSRQLKYQAWPIKHRKLGLGCICNILLKKGKVDL